MGDFTQKMGLATWDQPLDRYDYLQFSNNWQIVDFHDHSPGRGVQIGTGGIAGGALNASHFTTALAQDLGLNSNANVGRGAVNIPTLESRTNVAYGTMPTPDQVTGVVLPSNGLIAVWYQATWKESVSATANAGLFLGSNQVTNATANAPLASNAAIGGTANTFVPLVSSMSGVASTTAGTGYSGDVTTGQTVGLSVIAAGPCYIFAAAGTYNVSVQFKSTSGSVTASNRKLWVWTVNFV